jgi:branched-chain amino acid transport system ATP-binding protein
MAMMLRIQGLSAGYGPVRVIDGLDLHVGEGETVTLLGPNGAGKSTLLAALTATIRHRGGTMMLGDVDLARLDSHDIVAAGLALVPEGRLVFGPLTVRDNLRLGGLRLARGHDLGTRFDAVYGLFPRLRERADQRAGTLSGGEQQMLAIGRAMMSAPRVLLLDEPFLGLAPMVVTEIRTALDALRASGLTLLLVEQKLDIALGFASRAYVMIKGRIALERTAADLAAMPDLATLYFDLATGGG